MTRKQRTEDHTHIFDGAVTTLAGTAQPLTPEIMQAIMENDLSRGEMSPTVARNYKEGMKHAMRTLFGLAENKVSDDGRRLNPSRVSRF